MPPIDPDIRATVRGLPVAEAHEALRTEDQAAAARLRPSDTSRVARALEVVRSTGRQLGEWQEEKVGGTAWEMQLGPTVLVTPRKWLYDGRQRATDNRRREGGVSGGRAVVGGVGRQPLPGIQPA